MTTNRPRTPTEHFYGHRSTFGTSVMPTEALQPLYFPCAWCMPKAELIALNQQYPGQVSHTICESCAAKLDADCAAKEQGR